MTREDKPSSPDLYARLYDILDRMLEPYGKTFGRPDKRNALANLAQPFDISRPNEHDSKADFQQEYDTVSSACEHLAQLIDLLIPGEENSERKATRRRLAAVLSQKLKANSPTEKLQDGFVLIRKMVSEADGYTASAYVLLDLHYALRNRLVELKDQQNKFWNWSAPPEWSTLIVSA